MIVIAIQTALKTPFDQYKTGIAAFFTRIDDTWGIKLYKSEFMRDKTFRLQNLAASVNAGPRLGNKFELKIPGKGYYYGYVTECVIETYENLYMDTYSEGMSEDDIDHLMDTCYCEMEDSKEYQNLMNLLQWIDITTSDMHYGNVGWLKNGRLVAIDFSHENDSVSDSELEDYSS